MYLNSVSQPLEEQQNNNFQPQTLLPHSTIKSKSHNTHNVESYLSDNANELSIEDIESPELFGNYDNHHTMAAAAATSLQVRKRINATTIATIG